MTDDVVLCINSGSSSLKLALIAVRDGDEDTLGAESIAHDGDVTTALEAALRSLTRRGLPPPTVIGHRVVHGGPDHSDPVVVDDGVLEAIRSAAKLAPLHVPAALAGFDATRKRYPDLPQVACFDTAFHRTIPEVASRYPVPGRFVASGVRKYGFHGLSYEYVMSVLGRERPDKIVIAHLGSGASLVAIADGHAVDTTMGLTPTGGVMMGTRSGDLDPGILLYLAREHDLSTDALESLLNREAGLFAVAGTADMEALVERRSSDPSARLAIAMFGYSVRKAIGSFVAVLGGIDLLVFTGGIGEHAAVVRSEACRGLGAFGIELDAARNEANEASIARDSSRCSIRVIPTDEDRIIARHAHRAIHARTSASTPR